MMRAVIYARYSSENQREASIEDQIEVCRRYAAAQGWSITHSYQDAAVSGASSLRPGFQTLLRDAERRLFDVVICEAIDRLGRKLSDVASMFDRLTFFGIKVHASSIGPLTQMHVGIMGTMAQMSLADLRDKTKRGQLGRARAGRIPGGLAYGYEVVPPPPGIQESGERKIVPAEAAIVARVFRSYAAGTSPRAIARDLNAAGIPGPGGRPWIDTTIRGQVDRGTGLLNNTLYIGRLSWNRCSYVKDPQTGRRVARVNVREHWEEIEVPALRIIPQNLWDAAKQRQAEARTEMPEPAVSALNAAHRHQYLLSGLLTCGCCGGGYTIIGKDRYGCATRRGKGICSNARTITRQHIEQRVIGALKARMLTAEVVDEFIRAFAEEMAADQREAAGRRSQLEHMLAGVERRLQGVLRVIEDGAWSVSLRSRLAELEASKAQLTNQLAHLVCSSPAVLHPNAASIYAAKVAELEISLAAPSIQAEAGEILRSLIERVVLTPDATAENGLAAELHGDLATILELAAASGIPKEGRSKNRYSNDRLPRTGVLGSQLSVVAGTGFEPVTFRL